MFEIGECTFSAVGKRGGVFLHVIKAVVLLLRRAITPLASSILGKVRTLVPL